MGSIYKRGKNWYLDVRAAGKRIRRKVGTSKKIAELALKDAEVKIARDEYGFSQKDASIYKFLDKYLEYSEANHSPATFNRYRAVIDHFNRYLKAKNNQIVFLSQIGTREIDEYKVFRKGEWINPNGDPVESDEDVTDFSRKGARAHTINFEIGTLRTIFNMAIKWDYLRDNPTKDVVKLKVNDSKSPRFLTEIECKKLLDNSPDYLRDIFFTFLYTGMRKAELENLEWEDIDFRRKKIKIRPKEFWKPKTGSREIPMNQGILKLFKELREKNKKSLNSNFIFPDKDGNKIKTKLREQLIKVAYKAKIKDLTKLHSLRHTFASQLVMAGVDLPTVQKLMGHSDIQTTMIYAHLAPDHLAEAVDKLNII